MRLGFLSLAALVASAFFLAQIPATAFADSPYSVSEVLRVRWGSGPGALGRTRPREANPECPMSFAVDALGGLHVLDQVNFRVQSFVDGKVAASFAIPSSAFQDLALDSSGRFVLLDRLVSSSVWWFDGAGRPLQQVAIDGKGIEFAGGVTALFPGDDGLWLEFNNGPHVRVATARMAKDDARPVRPGRPMPDGRLLLAGIGEARDRVELAAQPAGSDPRPLVAVGFDEPVFHIDAVEVDAAGRILLAVDLLTVDPADPDRILHETAQVVILSSEGKVLQRLELPPLDAPEEQLRAVRLGADGALYQLRCEEDAAVVRRIAR